jgi:hypothetical protein
MNYTVYGNFMVPKIHLVYSGQYRTISGFDWVKNHKAISNLSDSIVYTAWKSSNNPPFFHYEFDEPNIDYNPFESKDFIKDYPETAKAHKNNPSRYNLPKQIIAHQLAKDSINNISEHDIIIRMRYDTIVSHKINFSSFIEKVIKEQCVIGFGGWTGDIDKNLDNLDKVIIPDDTNSGGKTKNSVNDFMIIHSAWRMINTLKYHSKKRLYPANHGWHQILVKQHDNKTCYNYGGSVMLVRYFYS